MQIDWTVVSILVIAFFAFNGFFKGWWKEAITTAVITFLLVLLQQPDLAQSVVNVVNIGLNALFEVLAGVVGLLMPVDVLDPVALDAANPSTWVVVLFLALGLAGVATRIFLPGNVNGVKGQFYAVSLMGRVLGFGLGAVNGFLVLNLLREYLDGRSLPGSEATQAAVSTADLTVVSANAYANPVSSVAIEAVNLPNFTILDSVVPWVLVGMGLLIFAAALRTRLDVSVRQGWRVAYREPYGYKKVDVKPPPPPPKPMSVVFPPNS